MLRKDEGSIFLNATDIHVLLAKIIPQDVEKITLYYKEQTETLEVSWDKETEVKLG